MEDDRHYWQESILVHEFAHSVMCIGMDQEQRRSIEAAYGEAKAAGLYQSHIYMMANADEYWAEATQAWFDATVRTGQTALPHKSSTQSESHCPNQDHVFCIIPYSLCHTCALAAD